MIIFREGIIKQFTDREIALFCNTREESEKAVRALQSYGFRVNTDIYYTTTVIVYNSGIDCITSGSFPDIQYCKERII